MTYEDNFSKKFSGISCIEQDDEVFLLIYLNCISVLRVRNFNKYFGIAQFKHDQLDELIFPQVAKQSHNFFPLALLY